MSKQTTMEDRFANTKFGKGGGACFECGDYEGMYDDLLLFIRQEISLAIQEKVRQIREEIDLLHLDSHGTTELWIRRNEVLALPSLQLTNLKETE